jgi:ligand-binding sensor domain-containing protein
VTLQCFAQNEKAPPLQFENYTGTKILAHGAIISFLKDSKGFVWIGSSDGLNRFDGAELKTFRNNPLDSTTISYGWMNALAEDKKGTIWIACTMAQGLNAYNPVTGKFKRYSDNPFYKNLLPGNIMNFIFIDDDNRLWISTDREGLFNFDPATNKTVIYKNNPKDSFSIHDNSPGNICRADANHLYVSVDGGFDLLDMRSGRCRHFRTYSKSFPWKKSVEFIIEHPDKIFKDNKNNLWICTFDGLKMFDPDTEKFITYRHRSEDPFSISSDTLNDICQTPDGRLWITANKGELNVLTPGSNNFFHYHLQSENLPVLLNPWVAYDASGKIWIYNNFYATALNLLSAKFRLYAHEPKNKNSISWNIGEYVYQDHAGKIFVGTLHGLNVFDPDTHSFQLYQPDPAINGLLDDNNVEFISQDKGDTYWMEVDEQKLISYNPRTHASAIYEYHEDHHPDSLGLFSVYDMFEDKHGIIWFGGFTGLCSFNPVTKKFRTYQTEPDKPDVPLVNIVNRIIDFNDGKMWLEGGGLSYYEPKTDKIYRVKFKDEKNNINEWIRGNFLGTLPDSNKMVWLGTMGQGLYLLDFNTGRHRCYTMHDGLPSDIIWDLSKDDHGNLWLATNNGLCRFTPPKNIFDENEKARYRIYNMNDGLPGNEFGVQLYRKLDDGTIMCGTLSSDPGMVSFHPDSLKDNDFIPPVYITGFSLFNKEVVPSDSNRFLKLSIESTSEITLSYKENVFLFHICRSKLYSP